MMKLSIRLFAAFLLFIGITATALADNVPVYRYPQQTIYISAAQPAFVLMQLANPTTGYQWQTKDYDKQLLTLANSHYIPPTTTMIGASGMMVWVFKATPAFFNTPNQKTAIQLVYARPWNTTDNPKAVTFNVASK